MVAATVSKKSVRQYRINFSREQRAATAKYNIVVITYELFQSPFLNQTTWTHKTMTSFGAANSDAVLIQRRARYDDTFVGGRKSGVGNTPNSQIIRSAVVTPLPSRHYHVHSYGAVNQLPSSLVWLTRDQYSRLNPQSQYIIMSIIL